MRFISRIFISAIAIILISCASTQQEQKAIEIPYITTVTGLKYIDLTVGTGAEAVLGKTVTVNHIGMLDDSTVFENTYQTGKPPTFVLGSSTALKGYDEGILGMKVGGKRKLVVPSDLGFSGRGLSKSKIPANATLTFIVELSAMK